MKNEQETLAALIDSISRQTYQPDEVIMVDGGSTDKTVELFERLCSKNARYKLIRTEQAFPGKGRNIGIQNARNEWIALTDAGITPEPDWLEELVKATGAHPRADVIFGNVNPVRDTFFERLFVYTAMAPRQPGHIRVKYIASLLLKKQVWHTVGGFPPDLRAGEDRIFIDAAADRGFQAETAPKASVNWKMPPDLFTTFKKYILYSKHNIWGNRGWDWHYGILRQYLVALPFVLLGVFHSPWWLLAVAAWLFLRTFKRLWIHRQEYGLTPVFNPVIFVGVMFLSLVMDLATFIGWIQAILQPQNKEFKKAYE